MKSEIVDDLIKVHLAARCPFLYLVSWEEDRVLRRLVTLAKPLYREVYIWSITNGLRKWQAAAVDEPTRGPYAALESIEGYPANTLFVLLDFHPFITEPKITRRLRDLIGPLQAKSSAAVFISPRLQLPIELEKDIAVIDYPLPNLEDLGGLYRLIEDAVAANPSLTIDVDDDSRDQLLQAGLGLTENEARNVFAKALARDRTLNIEDVRIILAEKEQIIRKSGVLEYFSSPEDFGCIGGLDELKAWLRTRKDALTRRARDFGLPAPKGMLLLGVPGCGKSLTAKAIAQEWNQPLLKLDVGRLFGGLVGSSEENIRRTIQFAEAVAPCILWIDEIEKGFAGYESNGDSGTSARVFGTFLNWMQEKTSPVFVVATANSVTALPPEFLRKGRFDEIFFVDLPLEDERAEILAIHLRKHNRDNRFLDIDVQRLAAATEGFAGAELEQVVIAGLYHAFERHTELDTASLERSVAQTYPLSQLMKEPIRAMREWAEHRARRATLRWRDKDGAIQASERWATIGN